MKTREGECSAKGLLRNSRKSQKSPRFRGHDPQGEKVVIISDASGTTMSKLALLYSVLEARIEPAWHIFKESRGVLACFPKELSKDEI